MKLPKRLHSVHIGLNFAVAALAGLTLMAEAQAKVTVAFSAGSTCAGAPSTGIRAGGPKIKVSLCVTTTTESLCGHTTKLQVANPKDSGSLMVTAVAHGSTFSDPNSELTFPVPVTSAPSMTDFGATVSGAKPAKPGAHVLATFDIAPQSNAKAEEYTISLAPMSSVGVGADGACTLPTDVPISASFKLLQPSVRESKQ